MLSNCSQCKFFDQHPNHHSDIRCGIAPAYASVWLKLSSLDDSTLDAAPIDSCRDFDLDSRLEKKEIDLALTFQHWQQLARDFGSSNIFHFLQDKTIDHSLTLTLGDWQAIANSSNNPDVLSTLAQHGIEPEETEERWIDVDSSCIDAVSFHRPSSRLTIRFNSRGVYEYTPVTSDTFQDFLDADSQGRFFNQYIKDEYSCNHIGFAFA